MVGISIKNILHKDDEMLANILLAINIDSSKLLIHNSEIRFTLRFKCALGKRNAGITICGYKVIKN